LSASSPPSITHPRLPKFTSLECIPHFNGVASYPVFFQANRSQSAEARSRRSAGIPVPRRATLRTRPNRA
jgi:hypothetical protein